MLQDKLVLAICQVLDTFGIDLTDTTCQLVEDFVRQILAQ